LYTLEVVTHRLHGLPEMWCRQHTPLDQSVPFLIDIAATQDFTSPSSNVRVFTHDPLLLLLEGNELLLQESEDLLLKGGPPRQYRPIKSRKKGETDVEPRPRWEMKNVRIRTQNSTQNSCFFMA
jgi:hypothetical protein